MVTVILYTFTYKQINTMLTDSQIQENWDRFLSLLSEQSKADPAEGNRWQLLHSFYTKYEQRFAFMPASGKVHFHSAFPGGHVSHTLRVHDTALKLRDLWQDLGAEIDFTEEELVFSAINHDIGKFGTYEADTFVDQTSDWHKKRGEVYMHNHEVPFMKDYDRSLFLLQDLGVKITENEFLAIKLQSGLYEDSNKSYFIAYSPEFKLRSNLPYIIHQADAMSARIECMSGPKLEPVVDTKPKFYKKATKPAAANSIKNKFNKYL